MKEKMALNIWKICALAFLTLTAFVPCDASAETYGYSLQGNAASLTDETGFSVFSLTLDDFLSAEEMADGAIPFTWTRQEGVTPIDSMAGFSVSYNRQIETGGIFSLSLSFRKDGDSAVGLTKGGAMLRFTTTF